MTEPSNTLEVAVEQRLVGLFSATKALRDFSREPQTHEVILRKQCLGDIEIVRDTLSRLLDEMGGK